MHLRSISLKQQLFAEFLLCFLVGIILANLLGADSFQKNGNLTRYYLQQFQYSNIQSEELLWHVGCRRLILILLLLAFSLLPKGKTVHWVFIAWCGFAYGYFCVLLISAFEAKGLILCLVALCPHFFAYIPAYLGMVQLSERRRDQSSWQRLASVSVVLVLMIIGILLESYTNPVILQKVLNFF